MSTQRSAEMEAIWLAVDGRWLPGIDSVRTELTASRDWIVVRGRTPAEVLQRIRLVETACAELLTHTKLNAQHVLIAHRPPLEASDG